MQGVLSESDVVRPFFPCRPTRRFPPGNSGRNFLSTELSEQSPNRKEIHAVHSSPHGRRFRGRPHPGHGHDVAGDRLGAPGADPCRREEARARAPAQRSAEKDGKGGKGGKGGKTTYKIDNSKHDVNHNCKGKTFGYCTQNAVFAPTVLGGVNLTNGLIGLIGTNGTTVPPTTNGTTTPGEPEWCSPGFWRNNYPEAWGPTGLTGNETYSSQFGGDLPTRTQAGINAGAPIDPTLIYTLQNPQYYGGDDTNRIADLLSSLHPDINYTGVRVDNCPL
ncbi:hypothetical protein J5J01_05520 [Streptomyces fradiae]|uniref:hypothetical protein n=1 Tax=Streptomyces fradiae TaxID=1906 RepID=UPI002019437B|nr:hypothetical protein [Streptomyces fradiae]UQS31153.1 hypothetical protein J5J01_05520 [Streptomyces fradiae]